MELHGKIVVRRGLTHFAVKRELSLTDRIANRSQVTQSWDRQMTKPAIRVRNTRSIKA